VAGERRGDSNRKVKWGAKKVKGWCELKEGVQVGLCKRKKTLEKGVKKKELRESVGKKKKTGAYKKKRSTIEEAAFCKER